MLFVCCALGGFSRVVGAPVITDFTPTAGAPGDQVQLTGSGFLSGGITVLFWNGASGVVAPIVRLNSDTLITVAVPNGIATGPIGIQQGTGTPSYTSSDFLAIGYGPFITGFSPTYGAVNTTVVISGVHLTNTLGVRFNGTNATEFVPNAAGTQITTRVPPGATSGPLTVRTIYGTSNSPAAFTVVGPGPFIADFSPISGDSGTKVVIDGLHFTGVTNVTFNGRSGVILTATSDTSIQVAAPTGVTTGPIAVRTPLGTAVTSSNFFGKPKVTSFSPTFGRANTNVLVSGTNFLGATAVYFGGVPSTNFSVLKNSQLNASVPTGASTGLIRVIVPGGSAFSPSNFVIRPTIYSFSPAFGPPGTSVTITGANFNEGTPVVRFNGVQAGTPSGVSFGKLTAQVPAGATTGPISVTTTNGNDTSSSLFYLPAKITSVAPTNSGPGTRVAIKGQNLTDATAVTFNGTPAAGFVVSNSTSIGATVPGNIITGPVSVSTPAGVSLSSVLFYGAPLITNFTPTHGLPGTNVTIRGVNFLGGTVQFGGLKAATVSLNNTQIVAVVPSGAQTGPVAVLGPAGTNTSISPFSLDYPSNLQVSITNSPNPVTIGSNLVYTISIFNAGPVTVANASFTNVLPSTATLLAASSSGPWVLATNGNVLTGRLGSFTNGASSTLTLVIAPQIAGNVTDTVFVTSDNPDPFPTDNTASITTVVQPLALLSVGLLSPGVRISWPVTLTNYALQFEDALYSSPQWLSVTSPATISGGLKFVTETNGGPTRFYRLHQQ